MHIFSASLESRLNRHVEDHAAVMVELEQAFEAYEAGRISINGYLEAVIAIDHAMRRRRALWLWLCDASVVLRWVNRAERRAFREVLDALSWCRGWAMRQRGEDVTSCLASAGEAVDFGFGDALGAAA